MGQLWCENITERKPSEKKSIDRAEELFKTMGIMFITKDSHVVIIEQGYAKHEQHGDELAALGGILPGINPMIPHRS